MSTCRTSSSTNMQDDARPRFRASATSTCSASPYAMRIWLDPYKLAAVSADAERRRHRDPEPEHRGRGGRNRRRAGARRADAQCDRHRAIEAARRPSNSRNIILKTQPDRRDRAARRRRPRRARRRELCVDHPRQRPSRRRASRSSLAPGRRCAEHRRTRSRRGSSELSGEHPGRLRISPTPTIRTDFIKLSVKEVVKTLLEAIVLVVIVMFVFLQSWRATLIPAIAVPGRAARHLRRVLRVRLLDQHADVVRAGAGDRPARRRRDRRGRECRAVAARESRT